MSTLSDIVIRDVFANRPAPGLPGRMFYASDTGVAYRDNGTSWDNVFAPIPPIVASLTTTGSGAATLAGGVLNIPTPSGGGGGGGGNFSPYPASLTPPVSTNFSWVSQGAATVTDKSNRMVVVLPDSNPAAQVRFLSSNSPIPATPYTIDIGGMISQRNVGGNGTMLGAALLDGSGNAVAFSMFANSAGSSTTFRCFATGSGSALANAISANINATGESLFFVRITDDGTTRAFFFSQNGLDYFLALAESHNADVTPTNAGIMLYNNAGGAGGTAIISIFHWLVSSSLLPGFAA
jgi:hypothetical protein